MDAVTQIASAAPVAVDGTHAIVSGGPDAASATAFQLPMEEQAGDAAEGPGDLQATRHTPGGEALPDGGNLLPLFAGLLPPVTPLGAGGSAATVPPAALSTPAALPSAAPASIMAAARPQPERSAKHGTPLRFDERSLFEQLLARSRPDAVGVAQRGATDALGTTAPPPAASLPVPAAGSPAVADAAEAPVTQSDVLLPGGAPADPPAAAGDDASTARAPLTGPEPSMPPRLDAPPLQHVPDRASADAASLPAGFDGRIEIDAAPQLEVSSAAARPADGPPPVLPTLPAATMRPADAPATMNLATPVASPAWPDALGDRVTWLVQQDLGQAHLKLNPPHLGPVEVRVQVNGDQAAITFTAHNQQAREALEGASQRLRDLLGSQGFVNVQVDIGHHDFRERPMPLQHYDEGLQAAARPSVQTSVPGTPSRDSRALLDAYA